MITSPASPPTTSIDQDNSWSRLYPHCRASWNVCVHARASEGRIDLAPHMNLSGWLVYQLYALPGTQRIWGAKKGATNQSKPQETARLYGTAIAMISARESRSVGSSRTTPRSPAGSPCAWSRTSNELGKTSPTFSPRKRANAFGPCLS